MQKVNLIKDILEKEFSKTAIVQGEVIKISSLKEVNSFGILCLAFLMKEYNCFIKQKRSGTGITILVTF